MGEDGDADESIERFRRLTAPDDPAGDLDRHRLTLGKLLANRAGTGLITGWAEPPETGQGWRDAGEALRLFALAKESKTLDANLRNQARIAHARLATGMAILRGANAMFTGRIPDVRAIRAEGSRLPDDDPYQPAVQLVTGLINSLRGRIDDAVTGQREALRELAEGVAASGPQAPWRRLARNVLGVVTGMTAATDPASVPAERIEAIAVEGLAGERDQTEEAGVLHALNFLARYSRAIRDGESPGDEQTLADLRRAGELLPPDHPLSQMIPAFTHNVLSERYLQTGMLADMQAADLHLRATVPLLALAEAGQPALGRALAALDTADRAMTRGDQTAADDAIASVRRELRLLDHDDGWRPIVLAGLGECLMRRAGNRAEGLRLIADAADLSRPGVPFDGHHLPERGARARAELGRLTSDLGLVDAALTTLRTETARPEVPVFHRARRLLLLGQAHCDRYALSADPRDLADGIAALREADAATRGRQAPLRSAALWSLAVALELNRDYDEAIEAGLTALEELAAEVLLQAGASRGLEVARLASAHATAVARWSISNARPEQAVQALELGRGLVLHATTVAASVPALLRAAGRDDLVAPWQEGLASGGRFPWESRDGDLVIPSDIRYQVFTALRDASPEAAWLTRPAIADLAGALVAAGADAFVYLVPPGTALVVTAIAAEAIPLPRLAERQVPDYNAALSLLASPRAGNAARAAWHEALESTCDWAWHAVMAPVLRHAEGWRLHRPARLVLIPAGNLGAVPWHAARTRDVEGPGGRLRYAIDDAIVSYAATARQFARAVRLSRVSPAEQPVIVANPTGDLPSTVTEAAEIRRRYYPHAELLGKLPGASGEATPGRVLSRLPGGTAAAASLLHCGCHATVAHSLADSHLVLSGGAKLTIAEIVAQAERREPQSPGFLAVLGACLSDLTDVDHDEALTLASALLAAGAYGVVGARWPAEDRSAAQLLIMFHHFLGQQDSPAAALREAQLWMLDAGRAGLEDLPGELAGTTSSRAYRAVHSWAAFTWQGR